LNAAIRLASAAVECRTLISLMVCLRFLPLLYRKSDGIGTQKWTKH
jgi:hypothetical protein